MKHLRNWALRGYLIWSISVDCIAIGAIIWILLPMASGLLDEPLRKPTDMVQPLRKPTQGFLEPMQQPTVLQILDPSTMKEPVGKGSNWSIFTRNGEYVSGPFYREEEAKEVKNFLYGSLGDSPVSEYQKLGKDLNYRKTTIEGRKAPRIIEPGVEETPLKERIKEALRDIIGGTAEGLLGLIPPAEATMLPEDQDFFRNYIDHYYAGKEETKVNLAKSNAKDKLSKLRGGSLSIPPIAQNAIDTAVDIFGTDYGKDGKARKKRYGVDRLRADLERIGAIESEYVHLKNLGGGSDSGYWQVQPSTAKDSLENAPDHFGVEFDKKFAPHGWSYNELLQMTEDELQTLMRVKKKENQALAASFAAVKILQTFDY